MPVCHRHPDRPTRLACSSCGRPTCVDCTIPAAVGQKCPSCAQPTGRSRVITSRDVQRRSSLSGSPAAATILGVTLVIGLLGYVLPDLWAEVFVRLADDVRSVAAGEWWRGIGAALLHDRVNILHIGFNMYLLVLFGPAIEARSGSIAFALAYFAAAAGGSLAFQMTNDVGTAVGASGAIFGLLGMHLAAAFLARDTVAGRANLRQLLPLLAINLALPLFVPRIAWEAHIGGFVVGALIMLVWARIAPLGAPRGGGVAPSVARSVVAGAALVGCLGALLVV